MLRIAHIVNPVIVPPSSDLYVAQPVTFETMHRAKEIAGDQIDVTQFSAQYPEDRPLLPEYFQPTTDLQRSVLDVAHFQEKRKLPLLIDILDRLYEASTADYLIYSNVDIALQPRFYQAVRDIIDQGCDAFVINRRTISSGYTRLDELPAMYAEKGTAHKGWDCFIFSREIYPHFKLGDVCIGASRVGLALLANLVAYGRHFREFTDQHLTFHIGDDRRWLNPRYKDYDEFNTTQLLNILADLEEQTGPFAKDSIPGQFLWRKRTFGPFYEYWSRHVYLPPGIAKMLNRLAGRRSS